MKEGKALHITEKAKDSTFIDCSVKGSVQIDGRGTKMVRTKIFAFPASHPKLWMTFLVSLALLIISLLIEYKSGFFQKAHAYGECSEYGIMVTYDSLSGRCKCMSGYVMGEDAIGRTSCVSADSVCHDKYGFGSRYDSLSESCECSYGYILGEDSIGRTQCLSQAAYCNNQLGYNSRYSALSQQCECRSGYVIDNGRCTEGSMYCHSEHGFHSRYNSLGEKCECNQDYTFDKFGQCVEKQNNVYFFLEELDTDNRQAIIKSDYDYRYSLVSYGIGCYDFSFERYLNRQIVVNLGTDFSLDIFDKIVLQDDNETCDIIRVERADFSTTLEPEEDEGDDVSAYTYQNETSRGLLSDIFAKEEEGNEISANDIGDQDAQVDSGASVIEGDKEQPNEEPKSGASWYERLKEFLLGWIR